MNKKIAAVITSYNEEKRIAYLLDCLGNFDDIIVFDKGSNDNTTNIISGYKAKIYTVPLTDIETEKEYSDVVTKAMEETECDWLLLLTCSDIIHPEFYDAVCRFISCNDVDIVEIPFYRYSMGFVSKNSYYGDLHYKKILLKKKMYKLDSNIHIQTQLNEECKIGRMSGLDQAIAVYHLTHENLEMIIERHLRYAKAEASCFSTRKEGLYRTWRDVWRQIYLFLKLKSYKLGEKGKAQLCMLLFYRTAKYLNVYFDKEKEEEIKKIYDNIRLYKKPLFDVKVKEKSD